MCKSLFFGFAAVLMISISTIAVQSEIYYTLEDLGLGRWQYTYEVFNRTLPVPIEEFSIYFDDLFYSNLVLETPSPLSDGWDELLLQPDTVIKGDGLYDAMKLTIGISQGQSVSGFAVSFDWLGTGTPGGQFYEIISPSDYAVIDQGVTVPEPGTLLLIAAGIYFAGKQRKI